MLHTVEWSVFSYTNKLIAQSIGCASFVLLCSESSEILEEGLDEKEEEIAEKLEKFLPSFCMGEKCLQFLCVSFFFLLFFFACIFFLSFLSPYSTTLHKNCYTRKKLT